MKRKEVLQLHNNLKNFENVKGNIMFSHMNNLNLDVVKSIVDDLTKMTKDYSEGKYKLVKELALKDDKGKFILEGNTYIFADKDTLTEALTKYNEDNKETLDKYKLILEEEVEVDLYKVGIEAFQGLYVTDKDGEKILIDLSPKELRSFELVIK
jgi:hypothetical protein